MIHSMPDASDRRFDTRGCLTAAGLEAVRRAPVGGAPAELAQHLAACARCQERLLAVDAGDRERRPVRRPQPLRTALLMLLFLLVAALSLVAMYWHLHR
jgi:hypothetical protein